MMSKLYKSRDGRTLCQSHATTGAPSYHTDGCEACEVARSKGIVRPNADSVPPKQRGRRKWQEKRIDWRKIKPENRAGMADAVNGFRSHEN